MFPLSLQPISEYYFPRLSFTFITGISTLLNNFFIQFWHTALCGKLKIIIQKAVLSEYFSSQAHAEVVHNVARDYKTLYNIFLLFLTLWLVLGEGARSSITITMNRAKFCYSKYIHAELWYRRSYTKKIGLHVANFFRVFQNEIWKLLLAGRYLVNRKFEGPALYWLVNYTAVLNWGHSGQGTGQLRVRNF